MNDWHWIAQQWTGYRDRARAVLTHRRIEPEVTCLAETLFHAGICTNRPPDEAAEIYRIVGGGGWRAMPAPPHGWYDGFPAATPRVYPTPCPASPDTHHHIMLTLRPIGDL